MTYKSWKVCASNFQLSVRDTAAYMRSSSMLRHLLLVNISQVRRSLFMTPTQRHRLSNDLRGDESAAAITALSVVRPPVTHTYRRTISRQVLGPVNRTAFTHCLLVNRKMKATPPSCTVCVKAKSKCVRLPDQESCDRCTRLRKVCVTKERGTVKRKSYKVTYAHLFGTH
jgi:hypothetical protein